MLKRPVPGMVRRLCGSALVTLLAAGAAAAAWAAQPARTVSAAVDLAPPAPPPPPALAEMPEPPPPPPAPAAPPEAPAAPPALPAPPAPPVSRPVVPALAPPPYPQAAVDQNISGRVVLIVSIDEAGRPTNVEVEHSEPEGIFDRAAVAAAGQWKFAPAIENGRPVPSRVRVPVEFRIPPGEAGAGTPGVDRLALRPGG